MIIGSEHYITFDGRYFDFAGNCTYLLAKDFVHDTFAVLVKYDRQDEKITHKIIVLIGSNAVELDLFNDVSKIYYCMIKMKLKLQSVSTKIIILITIILLLKEVFVSNTSGFFKFMKAKIK